MKELPANKLDLRIKKVWRLNDAIWLTVSFLALFLCFFIPWLVEPLPWLFIVCLSICATYLLLLVVLIIVLPPIRYLRWRYELSNDYLDIAKGIIWKTRTVIPFIRVQNTDTKQGPLLRAFGLASVTVSTAAGEHIIPGLSVQTAEQVRDKAAELARIAQEDV